MHETDYRLYGVYRLGVIHIEIEINVFDFRICPREICAPCSFVLTLVREQYMFCKKKQPSCIVY